jgi:hypothetical protein
MKCVRLQYTIRAFIEGRNDRLDDICKGFCSMERTSYNLLRDGETPSSAKIVLRRRYKITNARWAQSAINQARAVVVSQREGRTYQIELYEEKVRNTLERIRHLSNQVKIERCRHKVKRLKERIDELRSELRTDSFPNAVFGSKELLRRLSIATGDTKRELTKEWKDKRSNHFFSGQANQRGNGNARLLYDPSNDLFKLEIRNWPGGDFSVPLKTPGHWKESLKRIIASAESFRPDSHRRFPSGCQRLAYSVRVVRAQSGYQTLISFELEKPKSNWNGRIAGIDINPEGIACTIASIDGNLIATRFFEESRFITASSNKRKWTLEDVVNRMLRWCRDTYQCNAVALEDLQIKGGHEHGPKTNFKLSNFMRRKMLQRVKLSALKLDMFSVEVDPAYSSKVAVTKYVKSFGKFNRHQLAAWVIARRALGFGEAPSLDCIPRTTKEKMMWNRSIRYYGYQPQVRTLPCREPLERKSVGDENEGGVVTKLLVAPPAVTLSRMGLSHSPPNRGGNTSEIVVRRAGRVRPNGHTSRGDGARGHRVDLPHPELNVSPPTVYSEGTVR